MKNIFLVLLTVIATSLSAQQVKLDPTISVSGEGKVTVAPDYASISIAVDTKGNSAQEVKKQNDEKIDAVLKYIKKAGVANEDFQTQRVSLNRQHDYEKKKDYYVANQSIKLTIRNLNRYDQIMEGLVAAGVNQVNSIEFKSTQIKKYESEARQLAVQNARLKADDFMSVTNQKIIKILSISDNSSPSYNPRGVYATNAMAKSFDSAESYSGNETLAIGEITVTANVNIVYLID